MNSNTAPKVTVLIPVYNGHRYVAQAIESILDQTFTDFELLLIDDGSTDRSVDVLRSYSDPRVRLVLNERNLGIPGTLNKSLGLARGKYFAVLDNDDYARPERLERQVDFLERHPDFAAVGTWGVTTDEAGNTTGVIKRLLVASEEVQSHLLFRCCLLHPSVMAKTAVLREYGYSEEFVTCADFDLWTRVARTHRLASLPEILLHHREHAQRATNQNSDRSRQEKKSIIASQLASLGLEFSPEDLERHFLLRRMKSDHFVPDRAYLEWASAWLVRLRSANRGTSVYPQRAFARVVAETWLRACRRGSEELGWVAWLLFWRSSLGVRACLQWRQRPFSPRGAKLPTRMHA